MALAINPNAIPIPYIFASAPIVVVYPILAMGVGIQLLKHIPLVGNHSGFPINHLTVNVTISPIINKIRLQRKLGGELTTFGYGLFDYHVINGGLLVGRTVAKTDGM